VTGKGNEMIASQAIKAGAYDYLPKDRLNHESLCRVINYTMEKYRLKQEVKQAMEKMAEMSTKDDLTGLYNRRYSNEVLDREMASAKRYKNDLTLCMMDLDHFKNINDTHGHSIGDMVLSDIGRMLKEFIRETDLICRYGGEEFTIILPNTDLEGARTLCERFRKMVAAHLFELNSIRFKLTVSIGIGLYQPARDPSLAQLTEMADRALYQAKNEGRNKVVIDT